MKTKILFLFFIILIKGNLLLEACQDTPPGILFLGQTGVGKSASINLIYNLLTGVKVEEERKFITSLYNGERWIEPNVSGFQAHKKKPSQESQTEDVLKVPVPDGKGCIKAVLLDTPGALDTSFDPYVDRENWEKVLGALERNSIHLIVIVMKPQDVGQNSLDILATKSFYRAYLAKEYQNRIVGLFTYSTSMTEDAQEYWREEFQRDFGGREVLFLDNKVLFSKCGESKKNCLYDRVIWQDNLKDALKLESMAYKGKRLESKNARVIFESRRELHLSSDQDTCFDPLYSAHKVSLKENIEELYKLPFTDSYEHYITYLESLRDYLNKQVDLSTKEIEAREHIIHFIKNEKTSTHLSTFEWFEILTNVVNDLLTSD